ncbi:flagellar P-ring protein [Thiohalobacter sp. COW1]|uniref:Flagellar P-ring protein n=1 Tax=Thiohalobacter thiocyanaticus TaxID=585455 RepID=A0A1Z4VQU5_9GAMM|nr:MULTISPECIES: flagellar basal body P-ring protein FlgI [Thiohalobacter]BAZ93853.1 flagellar P-ring protein [Thiohalobacter thiocyanaticus]BCO31087.1 flagellar P-ring protein [Thiohalobacter sp. COW1]
MVRNSRKSSIRFSGTGFLTVLFLSLFVSVPAAAERVKDIATVAGVRDNQLVGYGIVVGLDGTGDKTPFTVQSVKSMLAQFGVKVPDDQRISLKNAAAVTLSADLPPFAKKGQKIDITVSSIGDATSLRGGTLLMSPLRGADGQVYAIAQGNLVVGGLSAGGNDGSRITVNVPSVGRIPNGATVEREVLSPFMEGDSLTLNLHTPDFTTANRLARSINDLIGPDSARPMDAGAVSVNAPRDRSQRVAFVSLLENLEVNPGEAPARVIVNSRTGTVVIGQHVRVMPAAVAHGNLTVTITEDPQVSQPAPLSEGETVVTPSTTVAVEEEDNRMFLFEPGVTLNDIVVAVNRVGAAPSDLVAILEALKQAGALRAELVVL